MPDGSIGLLYERGEGHNAFFAAKVVFDRVALDGSTPLGRLAEEELRVGSRGSTGRGRRLGGRRNQSL